MDPAPPEVCKCCPVDCECDWSDWSACDAVCDVNGGKGKITRQCDKKKKEAECEGKTCPDPEEKECIKKDCPCDPECDMSDWEDWSQCTVSCGGGTQKRERKINTPPEEECECGCLEEQQSCNDDCCPVDCEEGDWGEWTPCEDPCGGKKTRTRDVNPPGGKGVCGGKDCGGATEDGDCDSQGCGEEEDWEDWSDWSAPPVTCGKYIRTRTRTHGHPDSICDKDDTCSKQEEEWGEPCFFCEYNPWGEWGSCEKDPWGTCVKHRKREVKPVPDHDDLVSFKHKHGDFCQCEWDTESCPDGCGR